MDKTVASGALSVFGLSDGFIFFLLCLGIWAWGVTCLLAARRLLNKVDELNRRRCDDRIEACHKTIRWLADGLEPMDRDAQDEYLEATGRDPLA